VEVTGRQKPQEHSSMSSVLDESRARRPSVELRAATAPNAN